MEEIRGSPQVSRINDFWAYVRRSNEFSKSARFAVQIGALPFLTNKSYLGSISVVQQDITYMCESAELPGRAFESNEYRYYGPSFKLPHISAYNDLDLTFYVRNDMKQKEFFDYWLSIINPKTTYDFEFLSEYSTDITVWQFSEYANKSDLSKATYKATFRRAYPINVFPMSLTWAEDNIHRLRVTFTYTDWLSEQEARRK